MALPAAMDLQPTLREQITPMVRQPLQTQRHRLLRLATTARLELELPQRVKITSTRCLTSAMYLRRLHLDQAAATDRQRMWLVRITPTAHQRTTTLRILQSTFQRLQYQLQMCLLQLIRSQALAIRPMIKMQPQSIMSTRQFRALLGKQQPTFYQL